jgi:hypothetical protein
MVSQNAKQASRIINKMKDCFQSFDLSVEDCDSDSRYDFQSEINNDHADDQVLVKYARESQCVAVNVPYLSLNEKEYQSKPQSVCADVFKERRMKLTD